jgi:hypothetical protein
LLFKQGRVSCSDEYLCCSLADLGTESLTDQKDSDAAVPAAAYHDVTLTNLDGSGFLSGDWATIKSETGDPAYSPFQHVPVHAK